MITKTKIYMIFEYFLNFMKFIKKLVYYFLKKKKSDDLDSIIKDVMDHKDPFIYK